MASSGHNSYPLNKSDLLWPYNIGINIFYHSRVNLILEHACNYINIYIYIYIEYTHAHTYIRKTQQIPEYPQKLGNPKTSLLMQGNN